LHVESATEVRRIPVAAFDYLHFDADFARHQLSAPDLLYTNDAGFHKIAGAVDSHELFNWLTVNGYHLCHSSFVTVRAPAANKAPDLTRLKLLKLLTLVAQDADTREIEEIFREEPKLSHNLLRLVNSVAVGARASIGSFRQAITMLGRRQLQRWLQLLIYADQLAHTSEPNPLMQLAAARGRQMELLAGAIEPPINIKDFGDTAFMTGIFSLLDVLLNLPMEQILDALPLQKDIHDALETRQGVLGHLLTAITAGEAGDFSSAADTLNKLGISPVRHATAQTAAFFWASGINLDHTRH
jgi:EAL and modified HD-GYP domain-containing signal transduction protein